MGNLPGDQLGNRKTNMKEIPLTRGQVALVDDSDYAELSQMRWIAHKSQHGTWYAVFKIGDRKGRRNIWMHRFILGVSSDLTVDHRDGNGLHNWRGNLRPCPHWLNRANSKLNRDNTSGFKGVFQDKRSGRWIAQSCIHGTRKHLGCFLTPFEAALAYDAAVIAGLGEFARTNAMLGLL